MKKLYQRCWAEIDLNALEYNIDSIRKQAPNSKIMTVVKANAYGHGDKTISRFLEDNNYADTFAVANLEEALHLRKNGIKKPILILGMTEPQYAQSLAQNQIIQSVFSLEYAQALQQQASQSKVKVEIFIKIDTGMGRIGFFQQEQINDVLQIGEMKNLCCLGAFTHFACADETGAGSRAYTKQQFAFFTSFCEKIRENGLPLPMLHCCNSAAIFLHPEMQLNMIRPGIILYGLLPSADCKGKIDIKPVMSLKCRVSMVKDIPTGTSVSYGRTFTAKQDMKIATITIGYADGYPRILSNRGKMLLHGQYVPVIGRVCMDQVMLDVTGIPNVQMGDAVTVVGSDGGYYIGFDDLADLCSTINYELVCNINRRVPRIYYKNGQIYEIEDYLL